MKIVIRINFPPQNPYGNWMLPATNSCFGTNTLLTSRWIKSKYYLSNLIPVKMLTTDNILNFSDMVDHGFSSSHSIHIYGGKKSIKQTNKLLKTYQESENMYFPRSQFILSEYHSLPLPFSAYLNTCFIYSHIQYLWLIWCSYFKPL